MKGYLDVVTWSTNSDDEGNEYICPFGVWWGNGMGIRAIYVAASAHEQGLPPERCLERTITKFFR